MGRRSATVLSLSGSTMSSRRGNLWPRRPNLKWKISKTGKSQVCQICHCASKLAVHRCPVSRNFWQSQLVVKRSKALHQQRPSRAAVLTSAGSNETYMLITLAAVYVHHYKQLSELRSQWSRGKIGMPPHVTFPLII